MVDSHPGSRPQIHPPASLISLVIQLKFDIVFAYWLPRLLEGILDRLDLSTRRKGEFLEARPAKYPPEQMADCLTRLGRLTLYINQLDISLVSDSMINWYIEDFIGQA